MRKEAPKSNIGQPGYVTYLTALPADLAQRFEQWLAQRGVAKASEGIVLLIAEALDVPPPSTKPKLRVLKEDA